LTSFKKIKKLTRDWRVTAHALKRSKIVELSADGHRVKRHAHLPDNLRRGRTMTSILAIRVPEDWATLEAITNLFSTYGNITLARVLRPGRAIPPDLRNYATQIPDMGATTCAVVDFDSTDSGLSII
jgi:la-related protein 6